MKWLPKVGMNLYNKNKFKLIWRELFFNENNKCRKTENGVGTFDYKDVSRLKCWINLYKDHGEKIFINSEDGIYRRDIKLLAIARVKNWETISGYTSS